MLLETEKERVCINQIVGQKKQEFEIEGDVIVNDIKPDVLSIISTDGVPCVYKKEVMEGKVRIDGSINTYIIYLADDENGSVRSLNTTLDFTQVIDVSGCQPGMTLSEKVDIKNIECRILNGRKISVKTVLTSNSTIYSNDNIEIISNVNNLDDVQIANNSRVVNSLVGAGNTKVYAKDTISIEASDEAAEIMKASLRIVNKDIKISYNKVLAKAETEVSIVYLTEDNRIRNLDTRIPIMGFIDIENIADDNICDVDYELKNLIIKPNNADMHSIYVEAEIEVSCFTYETKTINLIEDLYSISSNLNFTQKEITTMSDKQNLREMCNINEQISVPELGSNQLYSANAKPRILNVTLKNGKAIYEGEVSIELLYGMNNGAEAKNITVPFNFEVVSDAINEDCMMDTDMDIKRDDFIVNGDSTVNTNIDLEFSINVSRSERLNIINEISEEEARESNIYSMVIYFVRPGDTLWKIAKKFRSTVEDIARVNGIEDADRIYPGQQLYIPKYVKKAVAV